MPSVDHSPGVPSFGSYTPKKSPFQISLEPSTVNWINHWVLFRAKTSQLHDNRRYIWVYQYNRRPADLINSYGGSDSFGCKHIGWIRNTESNSDFAVFQTELELEALKDAVVNNGWSTEFAYTQKPITCHAYEAFDAQKYAPEHRDCPNGFKDIIWNENGFR